MTIRERIDQLLQLCGEDPAAALAARIDALPLYRDEAGWICVHADGRFVFVDNDSGRVSEGVPRDWIERALEAVRERYPEMEALRP